MAVEIKTILTADASELAYEFAKASAIAEKYATDRERNGARMLASAEATVESLRLEALGQTSSASALREKMALVEKAVALSDRTGISAHKALQMAEQELALRQHLTAERAKEAAIADRAARIAAPGRNGIALPEMALTTANLQAMEKGAARMNEFRRASNGQGSQGGVGPAMGILAVSQALEDSQYGIRGVLNNIPQATMAFGGFSAASMALAGGLSIAAVAAVALYDPMRKLLGYMDKEMDAESLKNWASAAAEAAKGIAKIREEARQEALMVSLSQDLNESLRQRIGLEDTLARYYSEQGKDQAQQLDFSKRLYEARRALAEANGKSAPLLSANVEPQSIAQTLENRKKILAAASEAELSLAARLSGVSTESTQKAAVSAKRLLDLREYLTAVTHDLTAGQKDLDAAEKNKPSALDTTVRTAATLFSINPITAGLGGGIYSRKKEEEIEAATLKNIQNSQDARDKSKTKLEQQISLLEKQQGVESTSYSKAIKDAQEKLDLNRNAMKAAAEEIKLLEARYPVEKQLADLEEQRRKALTARAANDWRLELSIQQALAANDLDRVKSLQDQRDIEAEKRSIMAAQKGISESQAAKQAKQAVDTRADAAAAPAKKAAAEELAILRARAVGENDRAGKLRAALSLETQILELMKAQNLTRAEATKEAQKANEAKSQIARGELMVEMKALQMEAAGDKAGADRLREDVRMRKEAEEIAQRGSMDESIAMSFLREKARLTKQIEDQHKEKSRRHSRIYTLTPEEQERRHGLTSSGLHTGGLRTGGLRDHALDLRLQQRANRPLTRSDEAAKTLLKSVNIQEEMLKFWREKINVV